MTRPRKYPHPTEPISRESARASGLAYYLLIIPCKNGHFAPRSVSDYSCTECRRLNVKRFHERIGKEASLLLMKKWLIQFRKNNPEFKAEASRRSRIKNQAYYTAKTGMRRAMKLRATPVWADLKKIKEFYVQAAKLTKETGIKHGVDHIVPLISSVVCGLHWEQNLQILTTVENSRKCNKLE